jgi:hypothetical protein
MIDLMTTEELAAVTGIAPEQSLTLFDLGALRGRVRLVGGRPMFTPGAIDTVLRAVDAADQAVAGDLPYEEAWVRVLHATTSRSKRSVASK